MFNDGSLERKMRIDRAGNFVGWVEIKTENQTFKYKFKSFNEFMAIWGDNPLNHNGLLVQDLNRFIPNCNRIEAKELSESLLLSFGKDKEAASLMTMGAILEIAKKM